MNKTTDNDKEIREALNNHKKYMNETLSNVTKYKKLKNQFLTFKSTGLFSSLDD